WLAVAYWVYKDARRRIEDPWLVAMSVVLGLIPPFFGALVYMLFRPPEFLEDIRERELEIKAMEERLARRRLHPAGCRAQGRPRPPPSRLPRGGRPGLPRLPGLHDEAHAGVLDVQRAAGGAGADRPVLRAFGRAGRDRVPDVRGAPAETSTPLRVDSAARGGR